MLAYMDGRYQNAASTLTGQLIVGTISTAEVQANTRCYPQYVRTGVLCVYACLHFVGHGGPPLVCISLCVVVCGCVWLCVCVRVCLCVCVVL